MIEVENSVVIDKPVADVFEIVGDPVKDPEWHFDVVEAEPSGKSNGAGAVGATYRWVFDYMGEGRKEATAEIKAFHLDQCLEILALAGPLVQNIRYRLEPLGPCSTLITRVLSLKHEEIPADMEEVMRPRIQNRGAQYLARLRQVLEGESVWPVQQNCACCDG